MQTESKPRRLLADMALFVVRKNPQEPAQTRRKRQKSQPLRVGFSAASIERFLAMPMNTRLIFFENNLHPHLYPVLTWIPVKLSLFQAPSFNCICRKK